MPPSTSNSLLTVGLVQTSAGIDPALNLARIEELLAPAPALDLIALPEVFAVRGEHDDYLRWAEPVDGPTTEFLSRLARRRRAWVLGGSLLERAADGVYNTSVLVDRSGRVRATYRKIHLFEAYLADGKVIRESDTYRAGAEPVLVDVEGWRCGLSICYDVRFPELFRAYSRQHADLLFVPANFTQRTGQAHWEILLRARAIENQCFVVAADQCGCNERTGIESHGHSMAVGPWGEVLARAGTREEVVTATLDRAALTVTRARIPVLDHRRL